MKVIMNYRVLLFTIFTTLSIQNTLFGWTRHFQGSWFSCRSCVKGSGNVIKQQVDLPDTIKRVKIDGLGRLEIVQGDKASLTVTAEDNIHERLEQIVSAEGLTLQPKSGCIEPKEEIVYRLTLKEDPASIEAAGVTRIHADALAAERLELEADGASKIHLKSLVTQLLIARIMGVSSITIDGGSTDGQRVDCSGASSYNARNFPATNSSVELDGVSKARINVLDRVKAHLDGVSKLTVHGQGERLDIHTSGLASYTRAS